MTVTAQQVGELLAERCKSLDATIEEALGQVSIVANTEREYKRVWLTAREASDEKTETAKDAQADKVALDEKWARDQAKRSLEVLMESSRAKRTAIGAIQSWGKLIALEMEMARSGPHITP